MKKLTELKTNTVLRSILCAMGAMIICMALLALAAAIPRDAIRKQSLKSAEYFMAREPFPVLLGDYINSVQDNYSDTVLCDIAYCIDGEQPFRSAIRAQYTQEEDRNTNEGYLAVINGEAAPDQEYGRYWHGSLVLIRPLLVVIPIVVIRILCGVLICALQLGIILLLVRRGKAAFAVCYAAAFILIHPWMLFTSLEYGTAFLAASAASFVLMLGKKRTAAELMPFFAVVGVVTCFVDFLTTETLTFTLPMLLALADLKSDGVAEKTATGQKSGSAKESILLVIHSGLCWLGGYLGMFALKIAFLAVTAGRDTVVSSMQEGLLRLGGEVRSANISMAPVMSFGQQLAGAVWHNLACLYPVHSGVMKPGGVLLATTLMILAGMVLVYLMHDRIDGRTAVPMAMVALLPFIRFLVLSNHAYIHFFITYRALMPTLAVFIYFVYDNAVRHMLSGIVRR